MNISDPWAGSYEDYKAARDAGGPFDAANQVIDVTAETISKRRSARDKARAFVGAARRSETGQRVEGAAKQAAQTMGAAAQNIGQNPMMQQAMGAMQNLPGGPVPYAVAAGALGTAGALALRQKMKQDKQRRDAMAAQMVPPISY